MNHFISLSKSVLTIVIPLCLGLTACGDLELTTINNPVTGATLDVSLSNNLDAHVSSSRSRFVTIGNETYTPDLYILGLRSTALIRCENSSGTDIECPGTTGREVNEELSSGQSMDTFVLNNSVRDAVVYSLETTPEIGDDSLLDTDPITESGLYSGLQFGLDFILTQYPSTIPNVTAPNIYVLLCLNENGCGNLTEYSSNYDGLSGIESEQLDLLFYTANDNQWYYFDTDADAFVEVENGRPTNALQQQDGIDLSLHPYGSDGELFYNASFGSTETDGLFALNITDDLIDSSASDALTAIFSVEDTANFEDSNGNDLLDADEIETLAFSKFEILSFSVSSDTFF